jgi:phosphopantetheine adenylyltransferase
MNSLVKSLILPFLTEVDSLGEGKTVGLFGGGFQPPTKGHFEVVKKAIEKYNPNEFIIFVGTGGGRSDITQDQSLAIWNIYKNYLPGDVKIEASPNPISSIYRYTKEHPFEDVKWFLGSRQGSKQDFEDFYKRSKAVDTRDNLEAINIVTTGDISDISGTEARQIIADKKLLSTYLPNELTDEEREEVFNILTPVSEGEEITTWVEEELDNKDLKDIDQVADEELETDVIFNVGSDNHFIKQANARGVSKQDLIDFFQELGKSKDEFKDEFEDLIAKHKVEKSKEKPAIVAKDEYTGFSIPFVSDDITKILAATVLAPGMKPKEKKTFSFSEQVQGDSIVCDNCGWTWKIKDGGDDLYICHKCGHDNTPKPQGLEHDKDFIEKLVSLTDYMMDHINIEPLPDINFVEDDVKNADDFFGKTAYYNPNDKSITLYTLKRHPKDVLRSFAHEMVHHKQNLEGKLNNIEGHNINEDDYLKELEREAYEYGNGLLFRGWENSIKGND